MRAVIAIVLAACAPITKYNITVTAEPHLAYRLAEIDRAIEALDEAVASSGLLPPGDAEKIIASKFLLLTWRRRPFVCRLPASTSELVMGCTDEATEIEVGSSKCVADSALTHELTHVLLAHVTARTPGIYAGRAGFAEDPDPDHQQAEWWQMSALADARLRETCPSK